MDELRELTNRENENQELLQQQQRQQQQSDPETGSTRGKRRSVRFSFSENENSEERRNTVMRDLQMWSRRLNVRMSLASADLTTSDHRDTFLRERSVNVGTWRGKRKVLTNFDLRRGCCVSVLLSFIVVVVVTVPFWIAFQNYMKRQSSIWTRQDFLSVLVNMTDPKLFEDLDSPQSRAVDFILNDDALQLPPMSGNLIQRYALIVFYYSLGGDSWRFQSADWTVVSAENQVHECEWDFVTCKYGHVIKLKMEEQVASGALPAEIGLLSNLQVLSMFKCRLEGTLPNSLYELALLETLNLGENILESTISTKIGDLVNLERLDLHGNMLNGTIPSNIESLENLETLIVSNNYFDGTIPLAIGQLSRLGYLDLDSNKLVGSLPANLGELTRLTYLSLHSNMIEGPIPSSLGLLTELRVMDMDDNALSGTFPIEIGNLVKCERDSRFVGPTFVSPSV